MFLIRLLRWLRSYVKFSVRVGSLERLLNICTKNGISVWNCKREGNDATGCTTISGYHRLRSFTYKNNIRLRLIGRYGIRFLNHRYRKRIGILFGVAVFIIFLVVSQQFVWDVRIEGAGALVSEEQLYQILEEQGVKPGSLKKNINLYLTARTVEIEAKDIAWAALNLQGTTAVLKVNERIPPPQKIDITTPANVVAAKDGQIVTLQVTDGKALLKEGDTVRAGEMIVSGVREDRWGVTHLVRANAKVLAHVPASLTIEVPLTIEQPISTGRVVRRSYLEIFDIRLPLFLYTGLEGTFKREQYSAPLIAGEHRLPIALYRESYIFYDLQRISLSQQQALTSAEKQLDKLEEKTFADCRILSKETSAVCENGTLFLRGEYQLEQNIALQVEIGVLERAKPEKPMREGGY